MTDINEIRKNVESDYIKITGNYISVEDWNKSLSDLGIDSLEFVELIVELEETYEFEFEDEKFFKDAFKSLNDICDYIFEIKTRSS